MTHRRLQANGIGMHLAEVGTGPLVVLVHGWPELWYSWRHQLPVLAEAGFHAVAPDVRGYGESDASEMDEGYALSGLAADIVSLLDALGAERAAAVVVDSGGPASHAAIVAREYGIPAVMATADGTRLLIDGVRVRVDGARGVVTAVAPQARDGGTDR